MNFKNLNRGLDTGSTHVHQTHIFHMEKLRPPRIEPSGPSIMGGRIHKPNCSHSNSCPNKGEGLAFQINKSRQVSNIIDYLKLFILPGADLNNIAVSSSIHSLLNHREIPVPVLGNMPGGRICAATHREEKKQKRNNNPHDNPL